MNHYQPQLNNMNDVQGRYTDKFCGGVEKPSGSGLLAVLDEVPIPLEGKPPHFHTQNRDLPQHYKQFPCQEMKTLLKRGEVKACVCQACL